MDTARQVAGTRDHYDQITAGWRLILGEDLHWGVFEGTDDDLEMATERLTDLMADFAAPEGARVLDVGCGVGGPATHLAQRFGWHITGISISPVGIETAKQKAAESDVAERLDFRIGDAMDLDFAADSFDVVWAMESSHLMPDKARLVSECHRVVKPGGTVVLCDLMLEERLTRQRVFELREDLLQLQKSFGVAELDTLAGYSELFTQAGLGEIEMRDVGESVVPTIEAWEANIDAEHAELRRNFGDERVGDFLESCRILRRLYASEGWSYGIIRGRK